MNINQNKIEEKVLIYKKLFKSLLKKCKIAKSKIDVFHCTLYKINSIIQLTVILFSATSTFLQALMPGNRNGDIILTNSTDLISSETLEDEDYINFLDTTTLAITSYSSLIISFARHFKIEERIGVASNLIERFSDIISRIQYDIEILKPWESRKRIKSSLDIERTETLGTDESKNSEWITIEATIKKEYILILDIKKEIFVSYEKMIGTSSYRR